jgi:hypothetical protein
MLLLMPALYCKQSFKGKWNCGIHVAVMTGMQYKRKQQARGHAAGEGDQGWDSQQ